VVEQNENSLPIETKLPENSLKPTQFKVVSLVEIGEDTAREIGARGLTSVSTFMGKTGQRNISTQKRCG
jgi:hypothetical protein